MKTMLSGLALIIATSVFACSSAPEEAGLSPSAASSSSSSSSDVSTVEASSDTKDAIGVATWGVTTNGDTSTTVHGYDANGKAIVTVSHQITPTSDTVAHISYAVSGKGTNAKMEIDVVTKPGAGESGGDEVTSKIGTNTIVDQPSAQKILDLLSADTDDAEWNTASEKSVTKGQVSLGTKSLELEDVQLTKGVCVKLNLKCGLQLGKTVKGALTTGKDCFQLGKNVALVADCAAEGAEDGAVAGSVEPGGGTAAGAVVGGVVGGLVCALPKAGAIFKSAKGCAEGIKNGINNVKDTASECKGDCGAAGGGAPAAPADPRT